jgi:hypothetical protein
MPTESPDGETLACCGLDCSVCDIRRCPSDPDLAANMTAWFRENVNPHADPSWFHCSGCHGDRDGHWSADCWILRCCVDDHGLHDCSECDEFPCDRLRMWSAESRKYASAFRRLEALHAGRG